MLTIITRNTSAIRIHSCYNDYLYYTRFLHSKNPDHRTEQSEVEEEQRGINIAAFRVQGIGITVWGLGFRVEVPATVIVFLVVAPAVILLALRVSLSILLGQQRFQHDL